MNPNYELEKMKPADSKGIVKEGLSYDVGVTSDVDNMNFDNEIIDDTVTTCVVDRWGEGELSSLWAISNHYGVSIEEIKKLNPEIGDDNVIHPQQIIKLPIKNIEDADELKETVNNGSLKENVDETLGQETDVNIEAQNDFVIVEKNKNSSLWAISNNCGVSIEEIKKLNPEIGANNIIHVGQKIKIPLKNSEINDKVATTENSEVKEFEERKNDSTNEQKVTESANVTTNSTGGATFSNYRVTSYHPGDNYSSGTVTGSGKSINDFEIMNIDGKSVYTYNGKIVVATATNELMRAGYTKNGGGVIQEGKHYFSYFDEFTLTINGKNYEAIVLDSCGAAMWEGEYRIDLFVPSSSDVINANDVVISNI